MAETDDLDRAAIFEDVMAAALKRGVDPDQTARAKAVLDPAADAGAQDFAELMGTALPATASPAPTEPVPRLPAPNPAQGAAAMAGPAPPDPVEVFEDAVRWSVRTSDHQGNWRPL